MLEATKRPALRWLHRTPRGEALLVRIYLEAERHAEEAAPWEPLLASGPVWLGRWLDHHRAEERRHAALFAERLAALGAPDAAPAAGGLDRLSRGKLRDLHRLIDTFAPRFAAGAVVPALAVALRMEEMGARVFARHIDVLARHCPDAPLFPLLTTVLADERRHVRACERGLDRLLAPGERAELETLLERIDRIERRFGVLGALALLAAGVVSWISTGIESSISRWRTGAAT